ncbi:hypothetical protein MASR1M45_12590 [Candidatus Kapaibacterium sp.]
MKFDAGSWWLLAGIITVMVTVIGALLTIIAKYLIWVPFQDLKISITHLYGTDKRAKYIISIAETRARQSEKQHN